MWDPFDYPLSKILATMMSSLLTRLDTVSRRTRVQQTSQAPPLTPSTINSATTDTTPSRQTSVQSHTRSSPSLTTNTTATSWGPTVSPRSSHQQPQRQYWPNHLRSASSSRLTPEQRTALEESFTAKYADLTARAATLLAEIQALKYLGSISQVVNFSSSSPIGVAEDNGEDHRQIITEEEALHLDEDMLAFLRGIGYGKLSSSRPYQPSNTDGSSESYVKPQTPIRALARSITASISLYDRDAALDVVIQDFESLLPDDLSSFYTSVLPVEISTRASLLAAALPPSPDPGKFVDEAVMHFEHEIIAAQNPGWYSNSTTFKSKASIAVIPRERFLSTSDMYAWDMQELVNDIVLKGHDKEWKNPVTGEAFGPEDVKRIREHPLGRGLIIQAQNSASARVEEEKEVSSFSTEKETYEANTTTTTTTTTTTSPFRFHSTLPRTGEPGETNSTLPFSYFSPASGPNNKPSPASSTTRTGSLPFSTFLKSSSLGTRKVPTSPTHPPPPPPPPPPPAQSQSQSQSQSPFSLDFSKLSLSQATDKQKQAWTLPHFTYKPSLPGSFPISELPSELAELGCDEVPAPAPPAPAPAPVVSLDTKSTVESKNPFLDGSNLEGQESEQGHKQKVGGKEVEEEEDKESSEFDWANQPLAFESKSKGGRMPGSWSGRC
ncbi:hypothetical protein QBC43DRAFT_319034 [Cladorrhinum sp. PSN259]|nr:hypothetical protein QBC43DRAFT_319034 [Cladorrhinum sp. PSN259]